MASEDPTNALDAGSEAPTQPLGERHPSTPRFVVAPEDEARYERRTELGKGGMGVVVEAHDREFNRTVAMKTLRGAKVTTEELDLFVSEAQINSQLEHPNMVPVHDMGVDDEGRPYFTMRLVRGHQSLEDLIAQLKKGDRALHQTYTFERRVHLIQQVCHALEYAHQRGVVHCDIKPTNIVVGDCGELFVVDWGISQLVSASDEAHPHGRVATSLDRDEEDAKLYGTTRYMAPERIVDATLDATPSSDIYSLCAVLYELLSLEHYLGDAATKAEPVIAYHILKEPRVSAESHFHPTHGRVPRTLSHICAKGLALEPEDRFTSVAELREVLQRWVEGKIPMVCPGTTIQRGLATISRGIDRHPVAGPALILAGLSGVILTVVLAALNLAGG